MRDRGKEGKEGRKETGGGREEWGKRRRGEMANGKEEKVSCYQPLTLIIAHQFPVLLTCSK